MKTGRALGLTRFDGPLRRRTRQVGRFAAAAATPGLYPKAPIARAFWFDGIANFGDGLTPWLLRRAGVIPVQSVASSADIVGVGSVLEMLPGDFDGAVWGSGSLRGEPIHLPQARFLAVRGALTRDLVSADSDVPLGDPGILVSRYMRRPRARARLGIVPHHMHEDDALWASAASVEGVTVIDVRRGPSAVLHDIAQCETVLTTSLHGLITADSFGIPAVWTRREPDLWGGRFKFDDYESALTPGRSRLVSIETVNDVMASSSTARPVDASVIRRRQEGLLQALHDLDLDRVAPPRAILKAWPARSRPDRVSDG